MTRDEIVTALGYCAVSNCEECNGAGYGDKMCCCSDALKLSAADAIEKLLDRCARYAEEIAVAQERQRWIPVTERLPENEKQVFVFVGYANSMIGFMTVSTYFAFDPEPHWQWDGLIKDRDQKTLYWMPLPEAPEVE